ncbi:phosphatase PAP2 family protein [Streptococcus pacificus]|uniref:Phosphatase PAP2 family protein n=1 Tax=Streptococcus pacificus TaxID=2740577 RepID=A0ABS0ZJC7_9STRE|nr:phosphatase PAP2 family protein [Streptococcus pacificus]MBJ8326076.1 phosphatase PAP2 family protein [Streptococcus pacificus]
MKQKQQHLLVASFSILFFVMLGYLVKFFPQTLIGFDTTIQNAVRGQLPQMATVFLSHITIIGNVLSQVIIVTALFLFFYFVKKWRAEGLFVLLSGSLAGLLILLFKNIYGRLRPDIPHLIIEHGFSFPSGHATGALLIFGSLFIICQQRLKDGLLKKLVLLALAALIIIIPISRIYLGVHYPSDVLAGLLLAFGCLNLIFPYYDEWRFKWRFKSLQK